MNDGVIYLVDTENVGSGWMQLFPELHSDDDVLLFYTKNSKSYSMATIRQLMKIPAELHFIHCLNGWANALDFQLCAVAGYLFHQYPDRAYVVVSSDKGFDSMIFFMQAMGQKITRRGVQQNKIVPKKTVQKKSDFESDLKPLFSGSPELVSQIADIMVTVSGKKNGKKMVLFNNELQKSFHDKGTTYYRKIKKAGLLSKL